MSSPIHAPCQRFTPKQRRSDAGQQLCFSKRERIVVALFIGVGIDDSVESCYHAFRIRSTGALARAFSDALEDGNQKSPDMGVERGMNEGGTSNGG